MYHSWKKIIRIMNTQKYQLTSTGTKEMKKVYIKICTRPIVKSMEIYRAMKYKPMPFYNKYVVVE